MTRRRWRLSTRVRVASTAMVVSALVLTLGAVWFIGRLRDQADDKIFQLAWADAQAVLTMLEAVGNDPGKLPELGTLGPWEVVERATGKRVASYPPACTSHPSVPFLAALSQGHPARVSFPVVAPDDIRAHCYTTGSYPLDSVQQVGAVHSGGTYAVYAGETVEEWSYEPVVVARTTAWVVVPGAVLLIAAVAWLAVRGALRPVDAVRSEVARISATGLRRGVPVPRTGDELSALAETMNEMLARLDSSTERQRQFVADSSHELRSPLATLRARLEVLLSYPDRMDWQEVCGKAVSDVERLQGLVSDLMLLARLDDHRTDTFQDVDLSALAVDETSDRRAMAHIQVRAQVQGAVVVRGHYGHLERMLRNLLDNAERHAASHVTVRVTTTKGHAALAVTDDGPGIPEADRQRVFDRFVRLDEARTRDRGGSGLGLAIARQIAVEHGGVLEIAPSETGAVLVARFPIAGT